MLPLMRKGQEAKRGEPAGSAAAVRLRTLCSLPPVLAAPVRRRPLSAPARAPPRSSAVAGLVNPALGQGQSKRQGYLTIGGTGSDGASPQGVCVMRGQG